MRTLRSSHVSLLANVSTEKRFISMELFYVPGIKKEYKPQGWLQSTHDTLFFAESEGWERRTETLKELKSSFHEYAHNDALLRTALTSV